jgi:hypothetical protein
VKAVERVGGRTGGRGQKAENPANRVKRMLQTANLDKGQWFAAGFMGDSSNTKIAIRSALPRSFVGKSLGARFLPGGAFEFRCIPGRGKPAVSLRSNWPPGDTTGSTSPAHTIHGPSRCGQSGGFYDSTGSKLRSKREKTALTPTMTIRETYSM